MASKYTAKALCKKLQGAKYKIDIDTLDKYEALSIEDGTIDTGSASMNAIISGSPIGGVPIGKTTGFYGGSGCGKSFIIGSTVGNFQKAGYIAIVVDTESAWNSNASAMGVVVKDCMKLSCTIIEELRNTIISPVKALDAELSQGLKLVVAIDSLAGLRSAKEVNDVDEGKSASDMGQRAKALKGMFVALTAELRKRNITLLWTNHRIGDPSQSFKSSIEKMPGGEALIFFSDVIVGMKRVEVADVDSSKDDTSRNMGARIPIECVKQRFISPFNKLNMFIGYEDGLIRYYGLWDIAREYGVIDGKLTYTLSDGTKLGYRKTAEADEQLWKDVIIPVLDPVIRNNFKFGIKTLKDTNNPTNPEEMTIEQ